MAHTGRIVTQEELRANSTKDSLYLLIHRSVYNVTRFLDEHPGGVEVMLAEAYKDATVSFEYIGHSDEARELLSGMFVGGFEQVNEPVLVTGVASNWMYYGPLCLGLLGAGFAYRYFTTDSL